MTSIYISDKDLPEPPVRPKLALVVIRRPGTRPAEEALELLAEVARVYGIEVLALLPVQAGETPPASAVRFPVRLIAVGDDRPETAWRVHALAETAADIVEFVAEERAAALPWDDVIPRRVGLVGLDRGAEPDLRERLARLEVPEPDRGLSGHA